MTREEAIDIIKSECYVFNPLNFDRSTMVNTALDMAIKALEQEPKTGHWIKTPKAVMGEGYMWYCDKCNFEVYQDTSKKYPSEKYCPHCGAKMEGESEDLNE